MRSKRSQLVSSSLVALVAAASACQRSAPEPPAPAPLAPAKKAPIVSSGALSLETMNGLILMNGTPLTRLKDAAMSTAAMADNAEMTMLVEQSPDLVHFLKYLVECALPEDAEPVRFEHGPDRLPVELYGSVGLAPEWATGACDEACQEWVSACLFARTNVFGLPVRIYITGDHPALGGDEGTPIGDGFGQREGSFYGNYFLDQPLEYSCRGDGYDPLYRAVRVCAAPGNICGFVRVGACGAIDGDTGQSTERRACDVDENDYFTDCWSRATVPGSTEHPQPSRKYSRVITIWVRPSAFAGGIAASGFGGPDGPVACGDTFTPEPARPVDPGPATAGAPCYTEDDCDSELLNCDSRSPAAWCTALCSTSTSAAREEAQCGGPGSSCIGLTEEGSCTQRCVPIGAGMGDRCPVGRVCTHLWIYGTPDPQAACYPFCSRDSDCPFGNKCNPRTGACGEVPDLALREDGLPCDPSEPGVCRGNCFPVGTASTAGLCGSFLNRARSTRCPDLPSRLTPVWPGGAGTEDDLAVCVYRNCARDTDCAAGLVCRTGIVGNTRVCSYAN